MTTLGKEELLSPEEIQRRAEGEEGAEGRQGEAHLANPSPHPPAISPAPL